MSKNQETLARMFALSAIDGARRSPRPTPSAQLLAALEEALADARERRHALVAAGDAGSHAYLKINEQVARWESARRANR